MVVPFLAKLEHGAMLTETDRDLLRGVVREARTVGPDVDLVRRGDKPDAVQLVAEGMACRYKDMPDGSRQIMALLVPGDFCDLHVAILGAMDHSIATLTPCEVVAIPRSTIEELTLRHARIARALWWCTLVDEGTLREWLVNLGQRPSDQRMAHLFCELLVRLRAVGRTEGPSFELPLTQQELGEVLGLSAVHVNRTLQGLRQDGLISLERGRLTILDMARLQVFAGFTPDYLHLGQRTGLEVAHRA